MLEIPEERVWGQELEEVTICFQPLNQALLYTHEGTSSTGSSSTPPPAGLGLGETLETQREGGSVMF